MSLAPFVFFSTYCQYCWKSSIYSHCSPVYSKKYLGLGLFGLVLTPPKRIGKMPLLQQILLLSKQLFQPLLQRLSVVVVSTLLLGHWCKTVQIINRQVLIPLLPALGAHLVGIVIGTRCRGQTLLELLYLPHNLVGFLGDFELLVPGGTFLLGGRTPHLIYNSLWKR